MPKFSVVLPVKNEEETLPVLFESLGEFMKRGGDLVIVDTGSTDKTIRVAEDFGARVVAAGDSFLITVDEDLARQINDAFIEPGEMPAIAGGMKLFDYGSARNFAHEHALNDMILITGADAYFTNMDIDALDIICASGIDRFSVDFLERVGNRYWLDQRLYDRRAYSWVGTMHEHLDPPAPKDTPKIATETLFMEHRPKGNANRSKYLANLAYALWVDPANERQAHCFARQLMYEKRYRSAIAVFMRHLTMGGIDANLHNPLP
jgi:glycosyltransferase involved in cell wall biosynthesis